jgi:hypothetical protein
MIYCTWGEHANQNITDPSPIQPDKIVDDYFIFVIYK